MKLIAEVNDWEGRGPLLFLCGSRMQQHKGRSKERIIALHGRLLQAGQSHKRTLDRDRTINRYQYRALNNETYQSAQEH
jgi:hypothetical protein